MLRIGNVTLENPLLLAPIAGYCDLAFRLTVRGITGPSGGVGLACTDLLCPQALLSENERSLWLAATCPEDKPVCMQLYGADPVVLCQAAVWAADHGATTIDINMGCPVDKVTKKNGGSKLLCSPVSTIELARQVVRSVADRGIPVTAKLRLGWDENNIVAPSLAPALCDAGIAAITIHGRTTEQMFRPSVRLQGVKSVVEAVKRRHPNVPVIGNGDVKAPADAKYMMDFTGCDGVMIGRGALGQPWIFRDTAHYLRTGELPVPLSRVERANVVLTHFAHLMRLRDERIAVNMINTRISWYSAYLQPWPGLKHDVRTIKTAAEFLDYMHRGIEEIQRREGAGVMAADAPIVAA
jgi:tRNA-dihydrouridine synthase B